MALEDLLAERAEGGGPAREEAGGDQEDAEAVGSEEIEAPPQEVVVGELLTVGAVRVLGDGRAAGPIGRVRDEEADAARPGRALLADPALEGADVEVQAREEGGEERAGELRPLAGVPPQVGESGTLEGVEEAADAGGGLQRVDEPLVVGEVGHERRHEAGDLPGDPGGGVVLVGELRFA
jgi:hypothetical protein